jgi:hypothetical protein
MPKVEANDVLLDAFGRLPDRVRAAVSGLDTDRLTRRPAPGANPLGWLVWHLTRVQDSHIAELLGRPQLWHSDGWAGRFGLDPDAPDTGYGHSPADVAKVRPDGPDALIGYYEVVHRRTIEFIGGLEPDDLARVVDKRWDPPVTLLIRLVSILDDDLEHVGQAAYVRGLLR